MQALGPDSPVEKPRLAGATSTEWGRLITHPWLLPIFSLTAALARNVRVRCRCRRSLGLSGSGKATICPTRPPPAAAASAQTPLCANAVPAMSGWYAVENAGPAAKRGFRALARCSLLPLLVAVVGRGKAVRRARCCPPESLLDCACDAVVAMGAFHQTCCKDCLPWLEKGSVVEESALPYSSPLALWSGPTPHTPATKIRPI